MAIVGLKGNKQSGKDSSFLYIQEKKSLVKRFAFGDFLKKEINQMYGIPLELLFGTDEDKNTMTDFVFCWANHHIYHKNEIPEEYEGGIFIVNLTIRRFMQLYGTEIVRKSNPNHWVDVLDVEIQKFKKEHPHYLIVITDVRFPNEVAYVRNNDGIVIGLSRSIEEGSHASEEPVTKDSDIDFFVDNQNMTVKETNHQVFNIVQDTFYTAVGV